MRLSEKCFVTAASTQSIIVTKHDTTQVPYVLRVMIADARIAWT
jgi:hypothetical protein